MDSWTKVDIFTSREGFEPVSAMLIELGIAGFQITDPADLDDFLAHKGAYWDYYDEDLLKLRDAEPTVTLYLAEGEQGAERLAAIKSGLERLKSLDESAAWGRLECRVSSAREQDWANNWKHYYHPIKIGERIVICPSWERYEPQSGEVVVKLDPGMAFGTGTHESTRLCLKLAERFVKPGCKALDLGCGSGILGISAVKLGAQLAYGIDIDENAARVAGENARLNGVGSECEFARGNLGAQINGRYGVVFANLVADILIEYAHHIVSNLGDYGVLIASGIIDTREADVQKAFAAAGLGLLRREAEGGWVALACQRNRI